MRFISVTPTSQSVIYGFVCDEDGDRLSWESRPDAVNVELMFDRSLYSPNGELAYHEYGNYLYSAITHHCVFYKQDGYVYPLGASDAAYVERADWLYAMNGTASYYYS